MALEAIGDRDLERLRPMLDPGVVISTGRTDYEGVERALEWAQKAYDYLDRRYVVEELMPLGDAWLVGARVEYVWRESGEVGDATPIWLTAEVGPGCLRKLALHDDEQAARAALAG